MKEKHERWVIYALQMCAYLIFFLCLFLSISFVNKLDKRITKIEQAIERIEAKK